MPTNSQQPRRRTARAWARLVDAWKKSGKSADEFAASRGIAPRTLTWWRWRLGSASPPPSPAPLRLVSVQIEQPTPAPAAPVPSAPPEPEPSAAPAWEIVTASGHVLRVHRGIAGAELAAVLAALDLQGARR